ncbi:tol-pal system protein YbgF [Ancylobacter terrae]|uniref:tol-pal system protein YbgF n=1 Tax=Ancylobacter sp. sgz301288 TaxID=3342077 RepID=UPI00385E1FE0
MSVHFLRTGALVLAVALAVPASAHAQQNNNFFGNLFKPPGSVGGGNAQPAQGGPDAAELTVRIDQLEARIRQMTGEIEQLQYRNQQLEAQVRRYEEQAVAGVTGAPPTGGAAPRVPSGVPAGNAPAVSGGAVAAQPGRRSDAFDPNAQPNAPGVPRPLGTTSPSAPEPAGVAPGAPMDLGSLSGAVAGTPAPGGAQVATLPPSNSPKDLYDLSYGYVLRQDYVLAGQSFRAFIEQYPNDRAVADAYYWLGESDYQRQQYKEAAESFLKVSTSYPNAVKAPDALLRLGQSLAAMGENEAACATLSEVARKFPRASATVRQQVEREQKRVRC